MRKMYSRKRKDSRIWNRSRHPHHIAGKNAAYVQGCLDKKLMPDYSRLRIGGAVSWLRVCSIAVFSI